jgi:hypothetical protein
MFTNLKALLVLLPVVALASQAQAQVQNSQRGLWELSPMAPLMGPRPAPLPYSPAATAAVRPDSRAHLEPGYPPITVQPQSDFWPRGNDGAYTLGQIQSTRNYLYQRLQAIIGDPRVSIETVMAVHADYKYWNQLLNWKLDRTYSRSNW